MVIYSLAAGALSHSLSSAAGGSQAQGGEPGRGRCRRMCTWSYAVGWGPGALPTSPPAWVPGPSSARRLGVRPQAAVTRCTSLLRKQSCGDGSGVSRHRKSWLAISARHALLLLSA